MSPSDGSKCCDQGFAAPSGCTIRTHTNSHLIMPCWQYYYKYIVSLVMLHLKRLFRGYIFQLEMCYRPLSSATFQWRHVMATASLVYSAELEVKLRSHSAMRKSSVKAAIDTWGNRLLSCQVIFLTAIHFAWIQLSVFLLDLVGHVIHHHGNSSGMSRIKGVYSSRYENSDQYVVMVIQRCALIEIWTWTAETWMAAKGVSSRRRRREGM